MNKKELSSIKKGFKTENNGLLNISSIYNAYCKTMDGTNKVIFAEETYFEGKEDLEKELYYQSFKKLLTGSFGAKLFDLNFKNSKEATDVQNFLYKFIKGESFEEKCKELINSILEKSPYNTDVLITIALGKSFIPGTKREDDESGDENFFDFLICSINKIEEGDKSLILDTDAKEVALQGVNMIVNTKKPVEGFLFPTIIDGYADVNGVVYCTSKTNLVNELMVSEVLQCNQKRTAKEEKELFDEVLTETIGESVSLEKISSIYKTLEEYKKNNSENTITGDKLVDVLKDNGIEDAKDIFLTKVPSLDIELNIDNLIPTGKKAVKIQNSDITIAVGAGKIENITQTRRNGKRCIVIEIDENVSLDKFKIVD